MDQELSSTIEIMTEINLLAHLDDDQISAVLEEANTKTFSKGALIYAIPDLTYGFDSEYWWDPSISASYESLISGLSSISRGYFSPDRLEITMDTEDSPEVGDKITFSFNLNQQRFSYQLNFQGDWVDSTFISKINQALTDTQSPVQYYWIDTGDQFVVVVVLNDEQFSFVSDVLGGSLKKFDEIFK
jgi:hypothetical protein